MIDGRAEAANLPLRTSMMSNPSPLPLRAVSFGTDAPQFGYYVSASLRGFEHTVPVGGALQVSVGYQRLDMILHARSNI